MAAKKMTKEGKIARYAELSKTISEATRERDALRGEFLKMLSPNQKTLTATVKGYILKITTQYREGISKRKEDFVTVYGEKELRENGLLTEDKVRVVKVEKKQK